MTLAFLPEVKIVIRVHGLSAHPVHYSISLIEGENSLHVEKYLPTNGQWQYSALI
jgi:hypothetical protein